MNAAWRIFVDLGIIASALLLSTFIRSKVKFFQKYLIPNSLLAGFILLPMFNYVLPHAGFTTDTLGALAYHLLSMSFVAMSLRHSPVQKRKKDGRIYAMSISILTQYALQALVGLFLTFIFISTFIPDLFESFGFLLPLGFSLGPGQAYAIGEGWQSAGIQGAGSIGLTFAALGFVLCCFGGVFLINYGIKKGWISKSQQKILEENGVRTGIYAKGSKRPTGANLTTESEAIDSLTFHVGLVFMSYFISYLLLRGIEFLLGLIGPLGQELATNLWGINFIFASVTALLIKKVMEIFKIHYLVDNATMNRISGLSVDLMVTSAIAAISIVVVAQFWLPITITVVVGGLVTTLTVPWMTSRIFTEHRFMRMLLIFGCSTGTLSTGLALLRVVDPEFESPVASDYTYASGLTFLLAIPFILSINLPVKAFQTGDMMWFWMAVGVSLLYLLLSVVSFFILAGKRGLRNKRRVWLPTPEVMDEGEAINQ